MVVEDYEDYREALCATQWRVTPLKGIWRHPTYFHDGSGAFDAEAGKCKDGPTSAAWRLQPTA